MRVIANITLTVVLSLLSPFSAFAENTSCAEMTYSGEKKIDEKNYIAARSLLEEAVKKCAASVAETSARPYIALGKVYFELKLYPKAIVQFQTALTKQPGLPLAYMDIGAAYIGMEDYTKAIEYSKKVLTTSADRHTLMEANFNIGLAYIKVAAQSNNTADKSSEPYFRASRDLDPTFGGNYYYLGVLKESADHDFAAARDLYKEGCERKYDPACDFLATVNARAAQETVANVQGSVPSQLSDENEHLMAAVAAGYKKKYNIAPTDGVIVNIRNACSQAPAPQCKAMLENIVKLVE